MQKITDLSHSATPFLYGLSKSLERASYYGLRAVIVLYMIEGTLKMSREDALSTYGAFTTALLFTVILGGVLGDLALGNRRSIILGALLQAMGAFCCCIPSFEGLAAGLLLIVIGNGLYTPNLSANFGKQYLEKTKLLDAGFSILFMAINIGAFLGVVVLGRVGEYYGWNFAFILAGALMILSIVPIMFAKEADVELEAPVKRGTSDRTVKILLAALSVGLFWAIYDFSGEQVWELQAQFADLHADEIPGYLWQSLNAAFTIPLTLLAAIVWSSFYSSQFSKLTTGFLFGAASFALLMSIPVSPDETHTPFFLGAMLLFSIAETYIGPVVYSAITQYANPKYLAIIMSVAFLPSRFFTFALGVLGLNGGEGLTNSFLWCGIAMGALGLGLLIYTSMSKPRYQDHTTLDSEI